MRLILPSPRLVASVSDLPLPPPPPSPPPPPPCVPIDAADDDDDLFIRLGVTLSHPATLGHDNPLTFFSPSQIPEYDDHFQTSFRLHATLRHQHCTPKTSGTSSGGFVVIGASGTISQHLSHPDDQRVAQRCVLLRGQWRRSKKWTLTRHTQLDFLPQLIRVPSKTLMQESTGSIPSLSSLTLAHSGTAFFRFHLPLQKIGVSGRRSTRN